MDDNRLISWHQSFGLGLFHQPVPMTIQGNTREFPTIEGSNSLSVPELLLGVIPTKQIKRQPSSVYNSHLCL